MAKTKEPKDTLPEAPPVVTRAAEPPRFSKAQLMNSRRYASRRDALAVLLDAGKTYTFAEADQQITQFLEGKVK
jgi:hypothetical protein